MKETVSTTDHRVAEYWIRYCETTNGGTMWYKPETGVHIDMEDMIMRPDETIFEATGDRAIEIDPTSKKSKRLLLSDSISYSEQVGKDTNFSSVPRLAVDRLLMFISNSALGHQPKQKLEMAYASLMVPIALCDSKSRP
jgi:hypothetical protein